MNTWLKRNTWVVFSAALGLFLVSAGMVAGVVATLAVGQRQQTAVEFPLYASASDTGESLSMATGLIDGEMEGAFFLDFITGSLSCVVMNSRKADLVAGVFNTNVIRDLGVEESKKPSYLMTTALANFTGQKRGSMDLAKCIVYVCDENTGNFAGYTFYWDSTKASKGTFQGGANTLVKVVANNARAVKNQE